LVSNADDRRILAYLGDLRSLEVKLQRQVELTNPQSIGRGAITRKLRVWGRNTQILGQSTQSWVVDVISEQIRRRMENGAIGGENERSAKQSTSRSR
jgi:hypothetical protein